MLIYISLIFGFIILTLAGSSLVRGAVDLAKKMKIPQLIIGLTIVSLGTSLPELIVSVQAALKGNTAIAIGNAVGSNITNVLLVLGLPALILTIQESGNDTQRSMKQLIAATLFFIALCLYDPTGTYHTIQGTMLVTCMIAILLDSIRRAYQYKEKFKDEIPDNHDSIMTACAFIACGIIGLPLGANIVVTSAQNIAQSLNVSNEAIGLTIVALGTSLPELATNLAAIRKKHNDIAIGNVIGSNLFNILIVAGITMILAPVNTKPITHDLAIMLAATIILIPFTLAHKKITRIPALMLVTAYAIYIFFTLG